MPGYQTPDQYGEHTTDISGRGRPGRPDQLYVPQPALPSMHAAPPHIDGFPPSGQKPPSGIEGDRPRMGGVFPGPTSRATVTPPPGPDETSSWRAGEHGPGEHGEHGPHQHGPGEHGPHEHGPGERGPHEHGPGEHDDQRRFDQFRVAQAEKAPAKPETPHVRTLPVLIGVIIAAALLVGAAFGLVYLISGDSENSGLSVNVGECVKRSGEEATTAACTDTGAFQVTSIVDSQDQCADPGQPYVVDPTSDGRTRVLCLKPVG